MNNLLKGTLLGICAGLLDVTPMIVQKLPWDANISAFSMWVVIGFILSATNFKMNSILKGIIVSFIIILPTAILIGAKEPFSLIPIAVMTLILGSLLGFAVHKTTK